MKTIDDLKSLRIIFHLKLAAKRNINTSKEEVTRFVYHMDDEEVQTRLEKSRLSEIVRFFYRRK